MYASTAAKVKAELPRDREKQDLFFDKVTDAVVADDEEDASDDAAPTTPPGAPPRAGAAPKIRGPLLHRCRRRARNPSGPGIVVIAGGGERRDLL